MKITMVLDLRDRAGELAQRLAHQPRLQARLHLAHLALDFGLRHERRDRIDHQHVDGAGAHQRVGDLERLLAGVGLGDQEVLEVDAELAGIDRVERVLGVDEAANAALLLRLGDDMQGQRGLARGFRTVDLDDAAARQAADAERDVEAERARGDSVASDRLLVLPRRMIEPLPNARSIWARAASSAFSLSMGLSTKRKGADDMLGPSSLIRRTGVQCEENVLLPFSSAKG